MTILATLYKKDTSGKTRQIDFHLQDNTFWAEYGVVGGKFVVDKPTTCLGKNLDKANKTTPEEQAEKEVKAKIQKKLDTGYFYDLADLDVQTYFVPMLAHKWEDHANTIIDRLEPIYAQPKLDGVRCIARWEGDEIVCRSRNGKEIIPVKFIRDTLARFLPKHVVFDGELYNHDYKEDFNKIISLVRKTKPRVEDVQECNKLIEYHVYDCLDLEHPNVIYECRFALLQDIILKINSEKIKSVTTHWIAGASKSEDLDNLYGTYLENGYEGQIIRINNSYEHKRSKFLIKRKEFKDDEFIVTDVEEGKGKRSGQAGALVMQTHFGILFNGAIKGSDAFRASILDNPSAVIGKKAHVRFFEYTPDGIPRFPVVHSIRDYE